MIDRFHLTFETAASLRNYTKAAEVLGLTQSAVSQQIHALEEQYSTELFRREGRHLFLTEEGKVLLDYVRRGLRIQNALSRAMYNSRGIRKRYLIGATLTIGEYVLPAILGGFKRKYPDYDILLQVENTEKITTLLSEDEIDLGFVEGTFSKQQFSSCLYSQDELIVAAGRDSGPEDRDEITIGELLRLKLILREKGSGTRKSFEEFLNKQGVNMHDFTPYMSIGSLTTIKSMVESGLGYTVISRLAVQKELNAGTLREIRIRGLKILREFCFIYRKHGPEKFIDSFTQFCLNDTSR